MGGTAWIGNRQKILRFKRSNTVRTRTADGGAINVKMMY
jgi:hypothetical protein